MSTKLLFIAGTSGAGKSEFIPPLRNTLRQEGFQVNPKVPEDSYFLAQANRIDHAENYGLGHVHPEGMSGVTLNSIDGSHTHTQTGEEMPTFPFVVTDNSLVATMHRLYFDALTAIEYPGITICELAGGENMHKEESPFFHTDLSFAMLTRMMQEGQLNLAVLEKTIAFLPVERSLQARLERVAPGRTREVTTLFGGDDFEILGAYLGDQGIAVIPPYNNENNKTPNELELSVSRFVRTELLPIISEGVRMGPERK